MHGGGEFTVARPFSGELYAAGGNVTASWATAPGRPGWPGTGSPLARGTVVTSVQAGTDHVLALTERGEVYAWAAINREGQLLSWGATA